MQNSILSIATLASILLLVSCKNGDSFNPLAPDTSDIEALYNVEKDLKEGQPVENSNLEKGDEKYCSTLEKKMKTFDKESEEMDAAWKLYKAKCHDCSKEKEGKKWENEKEPKDKNDYCTSLKNKLKKYKPESKEYQEIEKLIDLKCTEKNKDKTE